ncbi:MAG: DUF1566 domain-containing protein [Desulfococcaceae bacterium]
MSEPLIHLIFLISLIFSSPVSLISLISLISGSDSVQTNTANNSANKKGRCGMRKSVQLAMALVFVLFFFFAYSLSFAWPIPDTGQSKCYDNEKEIPCPQPGEPFYGQDGNYTINPPSYSKLDANGNDLPDSAATWVMVRDNVTGLIWEVKQNKDDVQDYDNPNDADNYYNSTFINALNSQSFGGSSDWRLPNLESLRSLTMMDKTDQSLDSFYFSNMNSGYYLSSSIYFTSDFYHNYRLTFTLSENSDSGYDGPYASYIIYDPFIFIDQDSFAIAIHINGNFLSDFMIVNGDGTVTDINTGLGSGSAHTDKKLTI